MSPSNAPGPRNKNAMTPSAPTAQPKITVIGPAVVPLLAIAVFINYVDRGNLATAAPLIKDQLHLSSTQIGVLVSAFFWSYVPAQILVGWVADRINPYRTLAVGLALWSIATALSGVATGFAMLISLRLLLGLGESAAFPCSSKLLAQHLLLGQARRCQRADWRRHSSGPALVMLVSATASSSSTSRKARRSRSRTSSFSAPPVSSRRNSGRSSHSGGAGRFPG